MNSANDKVSVIYHFRSDSPKHVEISRRKLLFFIIGLPLLTIIGISLGIIGLIHTSPFHLIDNYRKNQEAREAISQTMGLRENLRKSFEENLQLKNQIQAIQKDVNDKVLAHNNEQLNNNGTAKPKESTTPITCPGPKDAPMANSIGLSTLSMFRPVQNQKDKTRPASLSLNDFKVILNNRDLINFQFNIVNLLGGDVKLAGHIIVVLKTDQLIEVYPMNALSMHDTQINYTSGEPFATQRFRPVDASFPRPKKGGLYNFTVYIFAKNGDLIHYQSLNYNVKI